MRVLLVEDHADTRDLFTMLLTAHGHEVRTAVTGLQAIDLALESPPDVVVLDLQMPGLDGWAAARHLKGHPRTARVPIVALSARAFPEDEARAREVGCDRFVAKPCDPTRVLDAITRAHEERKLCG
jgi:two-component system, cell cycle response regulator DivK